MFNGDNTMWKTVLGGIIAGLFVIAAATVSVQHKDIKANAKEIARVEVKGGEYQIAQMKVLGEISKGVVEIKTNVEWLKEKVK